MARRRRPFMSTTTISTASAAAPTATPSASSCRALVRASWKPSTSWPQEAGLEVPKATPQQAAVEQRRLRPGRNSGPGRSLVPPPPLVRGGAPTASPISAAAACRMRPSVPSASAGPAPARGALVQELAPRGCGTQAAGADRPPARDRGRATARIVLQPRHVPDPRPHRPHHQFRRSHPRRCAAEIRQRSGNPALFQGAATSTVSILHAKPSARVPSWWWWKATWM